MNTKEFTKKYYLDRNNKNAIKWDVPKEKYNRDDLLPMWVADMDFRCPDCVIDGLKNNVEYGLFGYAHIDDSYYDAWINWNINYHNYEYKKEWLRFSDGAVSGIYSVINTFTSVNDAIMIQLPTYPPFKGSVETTNRKVVETHLLNDNGYFTMNYDEIESLIISEGVKLFILCSPHNPIGRVWTKEELIRLLDICIKHHVLLLSDEVHQDLLMPNITHHPILSIDEKYHSHIIVLNACAKTFNLAQLSHSHVIIPDAILRGQFDEYYAKNHLGGVKYLNALGSYYAYKDGREWLNNVLDVIYENYTYLKEELKDLPIEVSSLEGTYLIFMNLEHILGDKSIEDFMINDCKVFPNFGETFGIKYSKWIRINLATSKENVETLVKALINNAKH